MSFYYDQVLKPSLASRGPHSHGFGDAHHRGRSRQAHRRKCRELRRRFFAGRLNLLEESLVEESWEVAKKHEVIPQRLAGITSEEGRQRVMVLQAHEVRLTSALEIMRRHSGNGRNQGPGQ